ncbi:MULTISPECIES: 5-oxoprolinase subunit PxpB [Tatumella]|uniref:5-oxoprolinase subunit PxpB n=1 Tax=Tatumella punctata TaxID=399969 RepID=A0ABW1VQQ2_9GAMM|nr:5-oxoprolinase subunit PxpB [Tatumella sp. JGM16]MBS0875879.1 5-oxoprolinase subunit PxpB [Tatumella sp. JGM82]MBS0890284.1 5-oxoprolinase subunit PxpB [Tatumella sp. JGM94]MBS0894214.1 5-oxoprolinase subunit PxpB [Tatumella sp. JGM130]MBS0900410.1 5-oxoprolinase subunit PxpB [Tatumella sp. JGM100]MBS0911314.1 5-oxoprolinase subunit PxpB [Tatumella sp. JGM91]
MQQLRCYMLGEQALVLELSAPLLLDSQQKIRGLTRRLSALEQVQEVVPGMNNLTVMLREIPADPLAALRQLRSWWDESDADESVSRTIEIPVVYGGDAGPDLAAVARQCQLTASQVVERHSAVLYTVYCIGFQPGFPYLGGLDPAIHCPRRAEPRVSVPAGSVGIGGSQTGIYPLAAPGGWQLIGRTLTPLFLAQRTPPALLAPGDRVRFVPQKEGQC